MDQIERLYEESVATKNQIVSANLRLVVSIAKRYVGPAVDFFEFVSDGNLSLMRAVEKFDFLRGNRFSTYATWAIVKNFARSIPVVIRDRDPSAPATRNCSAHRGPANAQHEQESEQLQRESYVQRILGCLDERELQIVTGRFGLARGQPPLTLNKLGLQWAYPKNGSGRSRPARWTNCGMPLRRNKSIWAGPYRPCQQSAIPARSCPAEPTQEVINECRATSFRLDLSAGGVWSGDVHPRLG